MSCQEISFFALLILILLHSERPKLFAISAFLSAIGLRSECNRVKE